MNIRLREVEPGDLPLFFAHQQDAEGCAMAGFTSRERPAFDQHWTKLLADDTCLKKTVLADEHVVGNIGSWTAHGQREVGYWIDRAWWGRGVATAALSEFIRLEPTRPLYAALAKHNQASLRVLEKCGFTRADSTQADDSELLLVLRSGAANAGCSPSAASSR